MTQFTNLTSQFAWIDIDGQRQTLAFNELTYLLLNAKEDGDSIDLNKATGEISYLFKASKEVDIVNDKGGRPVKLFEDESYEII